MPATKAVAGKRFSKKAKAIRLPIMDFSSARLQADRDRGSILWCMCQVTPALASQILSSNIKNRHLTMRRVERYAGDMQREKWRSERNGDPIRINIFGNLCDGQHRLGAVIESNMAQTFVFVFNVDDDCFKTLDSGKSRNLSDVLSIMGYVESNNLSSAMNLIQRWEMGDMHSNYSLTNEEGITMIKRRPEAVTSLKFVAKITGGNIIPRSSIAFLHYVFSKRNKRAANEFINRLISGENLKISHPIYILREKLINSRNGSKAKQLTRLQKLAICVKAWNAVRQGKDQVSSIYWREDQEFPMVT